MAMKSLLMSSPTGPASALSPFSEPPASPLPFKSIYGHQQKSSTSGQSDSLHPPPSPYPQHVDPSPVDSNGTASTDATDIEDDGLQGDSQDHEEQIESPMISSASPLSPDSLLSKLDTSIAARTRADSDAAPQSVIHAPQDFKQFGSERSSPREKRQNSLSPAQSSTNTILSPQSPKQTEGENKGTASPPSPIETNIPSFSETLMPTPRAQTRQELEEEWNKRRNRPNMNLEEIPETQDAEQSAEQSEVEEQIEKDKSDDAVEDLSVQPNGQESASGFERVEHVNALRDGLSQCWTLCNTLASLSSNHRSQIFSYCGKFEVQEQAWRSCWKLCQNLYENREEDHQIQVLPTLEMCRDFCQALFEARQKSDEVSDSVLRVSFELNNHLYNTHDRNLPSPFQERTLEFYVALCHRLMKQRTSLPHETDVLLRACWTLAETLFNLRQNNREGKAADEELLGGAVQACWDLCDLFREGWTQVRPDRGTPRPSQTAFSPAQISTQFRNPNAQYSDQPSNRSLSRSITSSSTQSFKEPYQSPPTTTTAPPETPTTIFDDTTDAIDTDDEERNPPKILVLGTEPRGTHWSSASSSYSESSQRTSSTATIPSNNSSKMNRIRILVYKASLIAGFQPRSPPLSSSSASNPSTSRDHSQQNAQAQNQALLVFVKAMPSDSFGPQDWQTNLTEKYRKFVPTWPATVRTVVGDVAGVNTRIVQSVQTRVTGAEASRAVLWMMRSEQYTWMRDLFRVVFGCFPDDALTMTSKTIQA